MKIQNEDIILTLVEPKKKKFWSYIFIIDSFLIICGLFFLNFKVLPFELTIFIFFGLPLISIPAIISINHNLKSFKLTNNRIILKKEKLIRQVNDQNDEVSYDQIKKIIIEYSGFDEGPFNHPIFNKYPKLGNSNFIEIYSIDDKKNCYEFYIKSKRDSIVLKNLLEYLRSNITIELIVKTAGNNG